MRASQHSVASSLGDDVIEYVDDTSAPRVRDITNEEDDTAGGDDDDDVVSGVHAASRVDAIISQVTCRLAEAAVNEVGDGAELPPPLSPGSTAGGPLSPQRRRVRQMGTGATATRARPAGALNAEIAQILAVPRQPSEVREYVARRKFGKTPPFLRNVEAVLRAEQDYIVSLQKPREAPKTVVRLLSEGEKDELIRGLKQQFQYATACYLQAAPKSRSKNELEAELARIKQDIESLSRPYIFVEDGR